MGEEVAYVLRSTGLSTSRPDPFSPFNRFFGSKVSNKTHIQQEGHLCILPDDCVLVADDESVD